MTNQQTEGTEWCHTKEAATAYLESVGLDYEIFRTCYLMCHSYDPDAPLTFPATILRQYIRENHQLDK